MSGGQKVLLAVLLSIVALPVLGILGFLLEMAGGPQAIWLNSLPAPEQNTPEVVQRRADARAAIEPALDGLDNSVVLTQGPETFAANCVRGQNNWMVHEGYKHVCSVTVGRFYGWSGDFPTLARRLHSELVADGWELGYDGGLPALADQYETGLGRYETPSPGVSPSPIGFGWLWDTSYSKQDGRLTVRLDFANAHTSDFHGLDYVTGRDSGESWSDTGGTVPASQAVPELLRQSDGVLLATIEREYYRVGR